MEHICDLEHRRIWFHQWEYSEKFSVPFDKQPYACLIVMNLRRTSSVPYGMILIGFSLIDSNCREVVTAGFDSALWHDCIDAAVLLRNPDVTDENLIKTVWETSKLPKKFLFYFLECTCLPDGVEFNNFLVLFVGENETRKQRTISAIRKQSYL